MLLGHNQKSKRSLCDPPRPGTLYTHPFFQPVDTTDETMGKRKLHAETYFQCDWTGLPMRYTNCYMPSWNESGKLMKHGSYACWEAVVAHAEEIATPGDA